MLSKFGDWYFENVVFLEDLWFLVSLEGCLNKTANGHWTEVAIPHVLSSKE
jgi:hypothetical protein